MIEGLLPLFALFIFNFELRLEFEADKDFDAKNRMLLLVVELVVVVAVVGLPPLTTTVLGANFLLNFLLLTKFGFCDFTLILLPLKMGGFPALFATNIWE